MQTIYGPQRVFPGRLSVSRTFGDIEAKRLKLGGNPDVVIATPEIKAFRIKPDHDFIILGCDGIFDKLESREVVMSIWEMALNTRHKNIHELAGQSADVVMRGSVKKKTLDNITVVMICFENFKKKFFP